MRIDSFLVEINKYPSRAKAQRAISLGEVLYKGKVAKPSQDVENESDLTFLKEGAEFVSNGGYKLKKALTDFNLDVSGKTFLDIGASNGGFTDCLFKNGAKKVFCLDVGESQLDKSLLDKNVVILDNFNARNLTEEVLGGKVDGITCDVSFISLTYILPQIKSVLKESGVAVLLIKPQFECGKEYLGNSGIVKSINARKQAILKIYESAKSVGLTPINLTNAPIIPKKNVEYLILLKNNQEQPFDKSKINLLEV